LADGGRVAKSIPSDYIEIERKRIPDKSNGTGRSARWIPEAKKDQNQRARLSCGATPSGVFNVRARFVKSGSTGGFWRWPVTSCGHN